MTTESNQPTGDPLGNRPFENRKLTGQEPETTDEESGISGGAWRWALGIAVVLLLMYPFARWMMGGGGGAVVTQPAAGASSLQLSFQQYQAGRYGDAVISAKAALAANPNLPDAYNNLAVSYLGLRMFDEGIQAAHDAIRMRPDFQLAKNNLAWIQQEKAKALGQPVPSNAASLALLNQSVQQYQAGRFKECLATATQSAKLDPNSALAFNNVGICAGNLQLWDEAIRNTQEAIRLDPNLQLAKNNLAWMQQQKALQAGKAK